MLCALRPHGHRPCPLVFFWGARPKIERNSTHLGAPVGPGGTLVDTEPPESEAPPNTGSSSYFTNEWGRWSLLGRWRVASLPPDKQFPRMPTPTLHLVGPQAPWAGSITAPRCVDAALDASPTTWWSAWMEKLHAFNWILSIPPASIARPCDPLQPDSRVYNPTIKGIPRRAKLVLFTYAAIMTAGMQGLFLASPCLCGCGRVGRPGRLRWFHRSAVWNTDGPWSQRPTTFRSAGLQMVSM